ncbi:MAG: molybdenum cofactor guanylyltransferase MobA [Pseudomonadota bacterium]
MIERATEIAAVILAGGQATRMEGRDKGLVELNDKPLVQHVIDVIAPQVDECVISANRHREEYEKYKLKVVSDAREDFPGPLAGMEATMAVVNARWLFTCPCDSPFISSDIVARLHTELMASSAQIAVAHDGERPQPVFALIDTQLRDSLAAFLDSGERKIMLWFRSEKMITVDFSDQPRNFININTESERQAAQQQPMA